MTARNRDNKVIDTVACPVCLAPVGRPCTQRVPAADGRPERHEHRPSPVHSDRRRVWTMVRDGEVS